MHKNLLWKPPLTARGAMRRVSVDSQRKGFRLMRRFTGFGFDYRAFYTGRGPSKPALASNTQ
jgi:hypothetical protein